MSVPQLACVLKSFRDTGIITNPVLQDMFKAVIESVETERSEKISIKSLNNKYYDLDETTKEETKRILQQVLKNIR